MDDIHDLIYQCQKQNGQAEKDFFFRFSPFILTLCRRYACDEAEAYDLMQECFLQLFKNLSRYDQNRGSFEAWLYRISVNRILEILRKSRKKVALVFPGQLPDKPIVASDLGILTEEEVILSIQQLPNGYREILNLAVFEGWSHAEIAAQLNISESTSRSQLTRARKMLKKLLQKHIKSNYYEKRLAWR